MVTDEGPSQKTSVTNGAVSLLLWELGLILESIKILLRVQMHYMDHLNRVGVVITFECIETNDFDGPVNLFQR